MKLTTCLGACVVAAISSLLLTTARSGEPQLAKTPDSDHASIKAYPESIVTLRDHASGMLFYVESNGRRLVAFDKEGAVKWSVDVFDAGKFTPSTGAVVVHKLILRDGVLWLGCGTKAFAKADLQTGKVEFAGED